MHIADFKAENFRDLEKKSDNIPWELFLPEERRVDIHVTCKHSRLYHSDAVTERLQHVIEGGSLPLAAVSAESSATPSAGAPRNAPPQKIYVTLIDDRCTIWLDLAGEELYKRGHERFVNDAPLKETIAAAMIRESIEILRLRAAHSAQDDTVRPQSITLIDPMAGSGTFSLEAAYMASGLIPGKCRDFALMHQPAFKPATWDFIVKQESVILSGTPNGVKSKNLIAHILTSDISRKAVEIIRHNVASAPLSNHKNQKTSISPTVHPQLRDFFDYTAKEIADACPGEASPVIVLNPPYGKRLDFDAPGLYTKIGKKLAELARELSPLGKKLTVAILAPEDAPASRYTCTANLLRECPALDSAQNPDAKRIVTSHGGICLNALFATF
jgi:putative N6-adenine-specific DNA methylase